jgi:hypothetical protein
MAETQVARKNAIRASGFFLMATLMFGATGGFCNASSDLAYDGWTICGYGKVDYAAFVMGDDGRDTFVVKVDSMPNPGHYRSFHQEDVIRIQTPVGISAELARAEYVSRVYTILASVGDDRAVRILSQQSTNKKCDTTADNFDIKLCNPAYSCWDDGTHTGGTVATDGT